MHVFYGYGFLFEVGDPAKLKDVSRGIGGIGLRVKLGRIPH